MNQRFTRTKQWAVGCFMLALLLNIESAGAQNVTIPDANFKAALLADETINTNGDGEIQQSEAIAFTGLIKINGAGIQNLSGIEAFANLTKLKAHYNNLEHVDLSLNTRLEEVHLQHNQLTTIDLAANTELKMLRIQHNDLSSLDLSANGKLRYLEVHNNQLTMLNLQNGNNHAMYKMEALGNSGLSCIQVDDTGQAESQWMDNVDPGVSFSISCQSEPVVNIPDQHFKAALLADAAINTNGDDEIQVSETRGVTTVDVNGAGCSDITGIEAFHELLMLDLSNNKLTSLDASLMGLDYLGVSNNRLTSLNLGGIIEYLDVDGNAELSCIQTASPGYYYEGNPNVRVDPGVTFSSNCSNLSPVVSIPDPNFKAALIALGIDTSGDGEIQQSEAENVYELDVSLQSIADLTGIEAFTSLMVLHCNANELTSVDVSQNTNLTELYCQQNRISTLRIHPDLDVLNADFNELGTLDLSATPVNYLSVRSNGLTSLNLQTGTIIEYIYATNNPQLTCILVDEGFIEDGLTRSVDAGTIFSTECGAEEAAVVDIPDRAFKSALLAMKDINSNGDEEIQVTETRNIYELDVSGKGITDLTGVKAFEDLEILNCSNNQLTALDVLGMPLLISLDCSDNTVDDLKIGRLFSLDCSNNNISSLNLKTVYDPEMYLDLYATGNSLTCVEVSDVQFAEANWRSGVDAGVTFSESCEEVGVEPVVFIPDLNFRDALLANADINLNGDDEIQVAEAESFNGLIKVNGAGIRSLSGIEAFINVTKIKAHSNDLESADFSKNLALKELHLQGNRLTKLNLNANVALEMLRLQNNNLVSLDLRANGALRYLEVQNNNLISLNVRNGNNSAMYKFEADGNPDLTCIEVDDAAYAASNWSDDVDAGASFSEDCSGNSSARVADNTYDAPLDVVVYPNPSTDFIRIESETMPEAFRLYSAEGQEMPVRFSSGEADIRHLNPGIYFLKMIRGGESTTVRLMKN